MQGHSHLWSFVLVFAEGKSYEWEAVVLLRFMEEPKLMAAIEMVRSERSPSTTAQG